MVFQPGRFKLDFNYFLQYPVTPWSVTHITLLQFTATPWRRFVFFPTLEKTSLGFCFCLASISLNFVAQAAADFPGRQKHPDQRKRVCSLFGFLDMTRTEFGLATASSPSVFLSWILFDMMVAFQLNEIGCKRTSRKFMTFNKRRRWFHSSHVKLPLLNMSTIWCQHLWLDLWGPSWFCQTTSLTRLCGFWIRVSSLDFVLWWSSWSLPRCLQKMYSCALHWVEFSFVAHVIEIWQLINILVTFFPQFDVWCACCSFPQLLDSAFVCIIILGCWCIGIGWIYYLNHHIPQVKSKNTVHSQTSIQWYWCLLLAHPTHGDKCSTSENTKDSPLQLILNLPGLHQNQSFG